MHLLLPGLRQNLPNLDRQLGGTFFHASGKTDVAMVYVKPVPFQIGSNALEIVQPVNFQAHIPQELVDFA